MDVNKQHYLRAFHDGSVSVPAGAALFLSEPFCGWKASPLFQNSLEVGDASLI